MSPRPSVAQIIGLVLPEPPNEVMMIGTAQASIISHIIFESCCW